MSLILIVEDNEKNMKLVRDVLQVKGYATIEAGTAEDGIRLAGEHKPDLVLMDIQLPGMNGIEALGVLRAIRRRRRYPSIAVTASVMQQDRKLITEAGFDGYIGKPINLKEFLDTVRTMLERRKSHADGRQGRDHATAKVLVVDDTPHNVKLLADLLAVKGYAVATAVNGEEALAKVAAEPPGPRAARHHDAGPLRLRRVPAAARRSQHRAAARRARHVARSAAGTGQGHRGRRRRLPRQADQPARALRARALAAAHQGAAGRGAATGGRAAGMERETRGARRRAGRRARAHVGS